MDETQKILDNEKNLTKAILTCVSSTADGVSLQEIQNAVKSAFASAATVGRIVYSLADDEEITLEIGDDGGHWFFMPEMRRKYTLSATNKNGTSLSFKTDILSTLMEYVQASIETGARALTILTDPSDSRAIAQSSLAQDLDKEPVGIWTADRAVITVLGSRQKDCGCPSNLRDCKSSTCPRC